LATPANDRVLGATLAPLAAAPFRNMAWIELICVLAEAAEVILNCWADADAETPPPTFTAITGGRGRLGAALAPAGRLGATLVPAGRLGAALVPAGCIRLGVAFFFFTTVDPEVDWGMMEGIVLQK
jgi:hypothetical protein